MINYKSYKYAKLGNSEWLILYRSPNDFLKIYSEETEKDGAISIDNFNEIVDYFSNTGYDYLSEREVLCAMKNNSN
jgi:hypothetical protein